MKKLSKLTSILMAGAMLLSLAACGGNPTGGESGTSPSPAPSQSAAEPSNSAAPANTPDAAASYTVGICQLVQHEALDAATKGFIDAINEALPGQVTFDEQNASNDIPMCSTIINQFVASNVNLILANATPALQAATAATVDIPILGTSVTEYGVAMGIKDFTGTVGGNVSGTSDLAPLADQAAMVQEWFPDARNVGLIYCSAEPNSQYQVDVVKTELEALGYTATLYSFSDSNDLAAVTESAVAASDVIYVPTDNTVAANTGIIDNICRPAKIPVICGEEGIARGCGVATLSISYYDLGQTTGKMAVKILTGESDVSTMPVEYAPNFTPKYNAEICADLGLTPPEGYEAIG
ncbi:ABC transporter substrate-binding protein [Pseudoflavonifractor sp. BIOML-A6]|nr:MULTISPECIES: ABC transporter substrate-binding protein [unclassified Pseudoflavonifractor]MTQ95368.1 ABC transporter substrate-binding protein [Pseudoflavonifractor sp. BIOML-A16]MTR07324.1 ABC transporter substrate-binding protein [Pseudoflavonifractor sp. BIOML-A15]MTR32380.1 ABC transporter substrate-binding protein [Pseudoflavonifractor sp. BIOML-A14]MTR72732.1 ABC transporter substrate-binding protein [Pseudoflavonifractor sp. BIOML-A18]MTS64370.1 ABC transporter substrate-binding pro